MDVSIKAQRERNMAWRPELNTVKSPISLPLGSSELSLAGRGLGGEGGREVPLSTLLTS